MSIKTTLFQFGQGVLGDCESLNLPGCDLSQDGGNGLELILGTVFQITGAVAVLFILIGAFRYVVSGGNPQSTKQAWETILYAMIGLIISIAAFGIVTFVSGRITG